MPLEFFQIVYHANIVIRFYVLWVYVNGFEELFDGLVELENFSKSPLYYCKYDITAIKLGYFGIILKFFLNLETVDKK